MKWDFYLKQSNRDPTTSSANSFGSLPVILPILEKKKKKNIRWFISTAIWWINPMKNSVTGSLQYDGWIQGDNGSC